MTSVLSGNGRPSDEPHAFERDAANGTMSRNDARATTRRHAILSAVPHVAEILTRTPDLSVALVKAASALGQAAGVDRVNVIRYDHERAAGFLFAEWVRPGVTPVSEIDAGPYGYAEFTEVWKPLMRGSVYSSPLREKSGVNAALNTAVGTKTDLGVPVFVDEKFWGALNFDDCSEERTWSDGEVEVLRVAAAAVSAAVHRAAREQEHAEALAAQRAHAAESRAAELGSAVSALRRTVAGLAEHQEVTRFLPRVLSEMARHAHAHSAALFTFDAAAGTLALQAAVCDGAPVDVATDVRYADIRTPLPVSVKAGWEQLAAGETLFHDLTAPGTHVGTRANEFHARMGHRFVLSVPIVLGARALGFVGVCFRNAPPAAATRVEILEALATQAALALEYTRLVEEGRRAAVLDERNRFARDIHDTLAQGLAGIVMQLGAARAKLGVGAEPAAAELDRVEQLARDNLTEARRSITALRPTALERDGLASALQHVVSTARDAVNDVTDGTGTSTQDVVMHLLGEPVRLPPDVEMELYRVAEAALTNALRHARASSIRVDAEFESGSSGVRIVVADDGCGFDPEAPNPGRFGLIGMSERAARIAAVLTLVSTPGEGTTVVVMWRAP